jgi:hypothetical protein
MSGGLLVTFLHWRTLVIVQVRERVFDSSTLLCNIILHFRLFDYTVIVCMYESSIPAMTGGREAQQQVANTQRFFVHAVFLSTLHKLIHKVHVPGMARALYAG